MLAHIRYSISNVLHYSLFFLERQWIIRLALRHEADRLTKSGTHVGAGKGNDDSLKNGSSVKPADTLELIPHGVFEAMLVKLHGVSVSTLNSQYSNHYKICNLNLNFYYMSVEWQSK